MKEESTNVVTSTTPNPIYVSYMQALVINELEALNTDVQNSDFEQGFKKAKELAIKIVKARG